MTDDPREVLRAAGAKCAELDDYLDTRCIIPHKGDAAILALARLAAKYKVEAEPKTTDLMLYRGKPLPITEESIDLLVNEIKRMQTVGDHRWVRTP